MFLTRSSSLLSIATRGWSVITCRLWPNKMSFKLPPPFLK
nr:MAG TPA: hypothetical protein [Caudoviricetes sp.]